VFGIVGDAWIAEVLLQAAAASASATSGIVSFVILSVERIGARPLTAWTLRQPAERLTAPTCALRRPAIGSSPQASRSARSMYTLVIRLRQ
jgi:hypothetical protein